MTLEEYLDSYLRAEDKLRAQYGELAYYSRPVIYEKENGLLPVAPWAEYNGDPLILPGSDYVDFIAITTVNAEGQSETLVRHLSGVVELLANNYPVEEIELPVRHTIIRIPYEPDVHDTLHARIRLLPEVSV